MSLGVKQLWRVLSNSNGARGLSLIPRECTPALARAAPTSRSTLRALHTRPPLLSNQSLPEHDVDDVDDLTEFDAHYARRWQQQRRQKRKHTTTEVHNSGESRREAREGAPERPRYHGVGSKERPPKLSKSTRNRCLIKRLANVPVRAHPPLESVFIKPVTEYPDEYETRWSVGTHMKDEFRQVLLAGTRESTNPTDWRATLRNLHEWTPYYLADHSDDSVKVIIPNESVPRLFSHTHYSVWDISSRAGCRMVLYNAGDADYEEDTPDNSPYLILQGYHSFVNKAIDEILSLARKVTVISRTQGAEVVLWDGEVDGKDPSIPAPAVELFARRSSSQLAPYHVSIRADEFPKPQEWTRKTFEEYVEALVKSRMPSTLASKLYPEYGGRHEMAVIEQLVATFNDEAAAPFASNAAFKMALHYMSRGGETWRPEMLSLFRHAQRGPFNLDIEVFNILAEAAVKTHSLYRFNKVLYLMVQRGYHPNLRTWILFLRMFEAEEVKRYVLQAMNDRNLFNVHGALRMIANEMAPHDAYRAVQLGWDVPTFLEKQDELYDGEEAWVSIDALNKIFHVFGSYSKFAEIEELLDLIFSGELVAYPDQDTLNTILSHCKLQKKLDLAIRTLQMFESRYGVEGGMMGRVKLDARAWNMLFNLAHWSKKPHVLSVISRYTHLINATTYDMRRRLIELLAMDGAELKKENIVRRLKMGDEERVQFVRNLLIGDFVQANGGEEVFEKIIAGVVEGEEHRRRMKEMKQHEKDETSPVSMGDWFASQLLEDSDLDPDSSSPTTPHPSSSSTIPSSAPPDHTKQPYPDFDPPPSLEQAPPKTWGDLYGAYCYWSLTTKFMNLELAGSICSLLQQALKRDRELHLALRDPEPNPDLIKELMKPIPIPTKPRTGPVFEEVGKLFKWSGVGEGYEAAAVAESTNNVDEAVAAMSKPQSQPELEPVDPKKEEEMWEAFVKTMEQQQTAASAKATVATEEVHDWDRKNERKAPAPKGKPKQRPTEKNEPGALGVPSAEPPQAQAKSPSPTPTETTTKATSAAHQPKPKAKTIKIKGSITGVEEPPSPSPPSFSSMLSKEKNKKVKWEDLADL